MSQTSDEGYILKPEDLTLTPWEGVENATEDISDEEVYGDEPPPGH